MSKYKRKERFFIRSFFFPCFFCHEKDAVSVPVLGMKEESFSVWNVSGALLSDGATLSFAEV